MMLSKLGTSLVGSGGAGLHVELNIHSVVWHSLKNGCYSTGRLKETSFELDEEHAQTYRNVMSQMINA
jgi:hypothetical protein